jgi:hypothetical protein
MKIVAVHEKTNQKIHCFSSAGETERENYMKKYVRMAVFLCFFLLGFYRNQDVLKAAEHYLTPYQTTNMTCYNGDALSSFTMMGQEFFYGIAPENWGDFKQALYCLDGKFDSVTLSVGHWDGKNDAAAQMYIYADNELIQEVSLKNDMLMQKLSLDTKNVTQLRIEFNKYGAFYGIGDVIGYGGHLYESELTRIATPSQDGIRTYTCTICGDSYQESIVVKNNCTPYLYPYQTTNLISYKPDGTGTDSFSVMGENQYQGLVPENWGDKKEALYNLGQQHDSVSFEIGHIDNYNNSCRDTTLYVYADETLIKQIDLSTDMIRQKITLDTKGVTQLKFSYNLYGAFYAVYNVKDASIAQKDHNYVKTQVVEATSDQNGFCTYTCEDCGISYNEVIEKTQDSSKEETENSEEEPEMPSNSTVTNQTSTETKRKNAVITSVTAKKGKKVVSGKVIKKATVNVTVNKKTIQTVADKNGNFSVRFFKKLTKGTKVKVVVTKNGYRKASKTVTVK